MALTGTTSGTIAGYFENQSDAQKAVEALQDAGFTSAHLGVAHRGNYGSAAGTGGAGSTTHEKATGVWDKVKNFFEGNPEPYAEEGKGDLGTREITTSDTGSSYAGAGSSYGSSSYDHDDFHQSLSGLDVPEDRSRYMAHRFGSGNEGAVVTVNAGPRNAEAEEILRRHGADLGDNAAGYDYSSAANTTSGTTTGTTGNTGQVEDSQNIQLLGEILRVQKERVSRGEVRLRKEVITETQTVQVPVTREELVIERRPVEGATASATGAIGDSQEIRIPLTEETASLDKSTVVREEVAVGTKPVSEVRDLTGDVRHEELVVEDDTKQTVNR